MAIVPPLFVDVTEVYYLGKLTKPITLLDRPPFLREGNFFVTYSKKINPDEDCVEKVSLRNPPAIGEDNHQYFNHHDYHDVEKRTNGVGEVSRRMHHWSNRKCAVNISNWDADIVDRLRELPPHVKDVFGLK